MVVANLVPTLNTATIVAPVLPGNDPQTVFTSIDLDGILLGSATDDTILAFYRNGAVVKMFDVLGLPAAPPQTSRQLVMATDDAVPEGEYLMILRVNGQQAPKSPMVNLVP